MKRIALFVLALIAAAIANDEEQLKTVAEKFETDVQTVQICLNEAETNLKELVAIEEKFKKIKDEDDVDDETKQSLKKHGRFMACLLEKTDMMKDSKLVVDKIIEGVEKEHPIPNKEDLIKCLNELNEDSEITEEIRAFGLIGCIKKAMDE